MLTSFRDSDSVRGTAYSSSGLLLRIFTLMVFLEAPLKAYADPGSGLLFWQLTGAFFLGLLYQVRKFFSSRKTK
jgi:hypothetical protein